MTPALWIAVAVAILLYAVIFGLCAAASRGDERKGMK